MPTRAEEAAREGGVLIQEAKAYIGADAIEERRTDKTGLRIHVPDQTGSFVRTRTKDECQDG